MGISKKVEEALTRASWIRKMFEEGQRLRKQHGADRVFDFSLGNPVLEPPEVVRRKLKELIDRPPAGLHRYMPNAGHLRARELVAAHLAAESGQPVEAGDVIMTSGAGGALNVALKSLLDPGDSVMVIAPFFPEYAFYVDNHGGRLVVAQSAPDFDLDLEAIEGALDDRVKAVIINSPNNPTGRVYDADRMAGLAKLLEEKGRRFGHPITLLSDEPYRKIVFDGVKAPNPLEIYSHSVMVYSHSKDLGLAGERIGYAAVSPRHHDRQGLSEAMTFCNRTLGFVNAPSLFQLAVAEAQHASVPVEHYQKLRDLICSGLEEAGLSFVKPKGAFYVFPRTPGDEMDFIHRLLDQLVLAVPGSGFGRAGYVRFSFCVSQGEIERAIPAIVRAVRG